MARRRAIQITTTLLAVATATALFCAGWVLSSPAVADPGEADVEQVVRAFYTAINQTIQAGDAAHLDPWVDPNLAVKGPLATLAPDRARLTRYVLSLHATNPELKVNVAALTSAGNRAVVELTVQGGEKGSFLGGSLHDLERWGTVDALLIKNHRVLELWSNATGVDLEGPTAQFPLPPRVSVGQVVALDRMTLKPGGAFTGTGEDELRWLIGQQSGVKITNNSTDSASSFPVTTLLVAGQLVPLPHWSQTELRNDTREELSLLVLTIAEPNPLAARTDDAVAGLKNWRSPDASTGVEFESLTGEVRTDLPTNNAILTLAEATLAPRAGLADFEIASPCLLVVNEGQLDLSTTRRATAMGEGSSTSGYSGELDAGAGGLLTPCKFDLRNRGSLPAVLTIISFLPTDTFKSGPP